MQKHIQNSQQLNESIKKFSKLTFIKTMQKLFFLTLVALWSCTMTTSVLGREGSYMGLWAQNPVGFSYVFDSWQVSLRLMRR